MFLRVICNWAGTTKALNLICEARNYVPGCDSSHQLEGSGNCLDAQAKQCQFSINLELVSL